MDSGTCQVGNCGVVRFRRLRRIVAFALATGCVFSILASCASRQPLYVYRAYQDPGSARGPYYLRKALVAAPNHATAIDIVVQSMRDMHPGCTGPLYISFLGVAEDRKLPGLLGGPVWVEASGEPAEQRAKGEALAEDRVRESLSQDRLNIVPPNIP